MTLHSLGNTVACDTETTGLNSWKGARPFAFSFCDTSGKEQFRRVQVNPFTRKVTYDAELLKELRAFFSSNRTFVFYNAMFDVRMLEAIGIPVCGKIEDAMIAMHCLNSLEPSFKLKDLAKKYCGISRDDETALHADTMRARREGKEKKWNLAEELCNDAWMADPAILEKYSRLDAQRTALLWILLSQKMDEEKVREAYETEMRLWPVTYRMVSRGVRFFPDIARAQFDEWKAKLVDWRAHIQKAAPGLNVQSAKQLVKFLFEKEKMPVLKYTDGGQPSVDAETLRAMRHPLALIIASVRSANKAMSSFFGRFLNLAVKSGNDSISVIHPNLIQVGPVTGRYACREPNLQNVADDMATRAYMPIQARSVFGPRSGFVWVLADYSQLEIRIFAVFAQEPFMLDALAKGRDLHAECANRIWGGKGNSRAIRAAVHALELDGLRDVRTPAVAEALIKLNAILRADDRKIRGIPESIAADWMEQFNWDIVKAEASVGKKYSRPRAKNVFFAKQFGGGAPAVMRQTGCDRFEAEGIISDFDTAFPRIRQYQNELMAESATCGYVLDAYGRRITVDPDRAYCCVDYKVQGSAASLIKRRTLALDEYLRSIRRKVEAYIVLTIHDELIIEVRKEQLKPWFLRACKRIMENHEGAFPIALPVSIKVATKFWNKQKDLKV